MTKMTLSVFVAVVYNNRSFFKKFLLNLQTCRKCFYLFMHMLTIVYRLTVHYTVKEVVCGCLLL